MSARDRTTGPADWLRRLCVREALGSLLKACRAALRHPPASAMRAASAHELARAVRKALVHGPFVVRLGPAGPELPGDARPAARAEAARSADILLVDADEGALRGLVDEWARGATVERDSIAADRRGPPKG